MKTYEEGFIAGFSHNIKTVEELEERIKKAIEFVQKTQFDCGDFNCCGFGIWKNGKNELLEILKGNEK